MWNTEKVRRVHKLSLILQRSILCCPMQYDFFCLCCNIALNDATKNGSTSSGTTWDALDMHGATFSDVLSTGSKNMYEYHGFYTHLHD